MSLHQSGFEYIVTLPIYSFPGSPDWTEPELFYRDCPLNRYKYRLVVRRDAS
jgi:hypothetical protein